MLICTLVVEALKDDGGSVSEVVVNHYTKRGRSKQCQGEVTMMDVVRTNARH